MSLPRFAELTRYWSRHPPAHLLLGAWLRPVAAPSAASLEGLIAAMAEAGGTVEV